MLSLDTFEKYAWQTIIAFIIGLPPIIITTTKDKIIWIIIYTILVLIGVTLFSIIKNLIKPSKNRVMASVNPTPHTNAKAYVAFVRSRPPIKYLGYAYI